MQQIKLCVAALLNRKKQTNTKERSYKLTVDDKYLWTSGDNPLRLALPVLDCRDVTEQRGCGSCSLSQTGSECVSIKTPTFTTRVRLTLKCYKGTSNGD